MCKREVMAFVPPTRAAFTGARRLSIASVAKAGEWAFPGAERECPRPDQASAKTTTFVLGLRDQALGGRASDGSQRAPVAELAEPRPRRAPSLCPILGFAPDRGSYPLARRGERRGRVTAY